MLLTRRHRKRIFFLVLGLKLRGFIPGRGRKTVTCSLSLPGPAVGRGRGQHGAQRRVSGASAAVRDFPCTGLSAGGAGLSDTRD